MTRFVSIVSSVVFVGLVSLPCQASATSITEDHAAIGQYCVASGTNSTAMGYLTTASGYHSTTMGGGTTANGAHSTAMGYFTKASAFYSTVIGKGNQINNLTNDINNSFMVGFMQDGYDTTPELFVKDKAVGIGTTDPKDHLHVVNHIRIGEDATYPNVYGEIKHDGGGTGFKINANANGGWADLHLQTDETTQVFIESGGNVGIGTTSPGGFKLAVNGTAAKPGGGSWSVYSDARLKDITGEYGRGLDAILELRPIMFHYKEGNSQGLSTDEEYVGFIAQEVGRCFRRQ